MSHLNASRAPLPSLDLDALRCDAETVWFERLAAAFDGPGAPPAPAPDPDLRATLMASAQRLTAAASPQLADALATAAARLGVTQPVELYAGADAEDPALLLAPAPLLLQIPASTLGLFDDQAAVAYLGHQLGHHLLHGLASGAAVAATRALSWLLDERTTAPPAAAAYLLAREISADRAALAATRSLTAVATQFLAMQSGLEASSLGGDVDGLLRQCNELVKALLAGTGETPVGSESYLRLWALERFAATPAGASITGGKATAQAAAVEQEISGLVQRYAASLQVAGEPAKGSTDLKEFALAAAVLVAESDGEIEESEGTPLEAAFASLVPDWRSYLDPAVASRRLSELAPIAAVASTDQKLGILSLLSHIILVDGRATKRELTRIYQIGDLIGAGDLYRSSLPPMLGELTVEADDESKPSAVQIPPRASESSNALDAHLFSIGRRGGGLTTLRRLMRLLGGSTREALLTVMEGSLRHYNLRAPADLKTLDLDTPFAVELIHPAPAIAAAAASLEPAREQLRRGVLRLRDELVSGDGRSPSVRLRVAGRFAVDLSELDGISEGLSERVLAFAKVAHPATLVEAAEVGRAGGAAKVATRIKALYREHRARLEESGACELYLGYPFLTGSAGGYDVRGPLVLYPTDLVVDERGGRSWSLVAREDELPVANQALLRLLFSKLGYALPDALMEKFHTLAAQDSDALLAELAVVGLSAKPLSGTLKAMRPWSEASGKGAALEIEEAAVLGLFPQSGSDLLQDYNGLLDALSDPNQNAPALLGVAGLVLPPHLREALGVEEPVGIAPTDIEPVVYADPSQLAVLSRTHETRALVVDGPPGTGKSQVIVNLVADALARGCRVAVVCEKRAALDVVAHRLEGVGLRHLLAVVHDVSDDRKALFEQVVRRLEAPAPHSFREAGHTQATTLSGDLSKELDARGELLALRHDDDLPTLGELHAGLAGLEELTAFSPAALADLSPTAAETLAQALAAVQPHATLLASSPHLLPGDERPRASFAASSATDWETLRGRINATAQLTEQAELLLRATGVEPAAAAARLPALHAAVAVARALDLPAEQLFAGLILRASSASKVAGSGAWLQAAGTANHRSIPEGLATWEQAAEAIDSTPQPVFAQETDEARTMLPVALAAAPAWYRWFLPSWWSAQAAMRRWLATEWPERAAEPVTASLLLEVRRRLAASNGWRALRGVYQTLGGELVLPASRDEARAQVVILSATLAQLGSLEPHREALVALDLWPAASVVGIGAWRSRLLQLSEALTLLQQAAAERAALHVLFPTLSADAPPTALRDLAAIVASHSRAITAADRAIASANALHPTARPLLARLCERHATAPAAGWRAAVLRGWAQAQVDSITAREPGVAGLDETTSLGPLETAEARLQALTAELTGSAAQRVVALRNEAPLLQVVDAEKGKRRTELQSTKEGLLKEARKQRSRMPLRTFVRTYAEEGLFDLLPVWLVSPETLSVLFPREPIFDLVIMDEASQCTVGSGFPVLLRGQRVVIAGDEHQMPPTSFFQSADDPEEVPEDDRESRELLDGESLLVLARSRVPHIGLRWHYRCLFEELIAFSNHAMYQGNLSTIPATRSAAAQAQISWLQVDGATYLDGVNKVEAERVVDLVASLLVDRPGESLGVVTFNMQQRQAILDALDNRCESDPAFAANYQTAIARERMDERPFVKNLESVQGDERDIIIFSLGHAPTQRKRKDGGSERYVPARFGPLGQKGGERRLNVAVSRAKRQICIVASFEPTLLSVANTTHEGPRLFKAFLEFAWHLSAGRKAQAERTLELLRAYRQVAKPSVASPRPAFLHPLKVQVALALEALGHTTQLDVGTSSFRVPVAVVAPNDPHSYALGILCDEGSQVESAHARHVHTPQVLSARSWKTLSISARDWHRDREAELARITAALAAPR